MVEVFVNDHRPIHAGVTPQCRHVLTPSFMPTGMTPSAALRFNTIMTNVGHELLMGNPIMWDTHFPDKAKERCPWAWTTCPFSDELERTVQTHSRNMKAIIFWERAPLLWNCVHKSENYLGVVVRHFAENGREWCHDYDYRSFHASTEPTYSDGQINKLYVQKVVMLKATISKIEQLSEEQCKLMESNGHQNVMGNDVRLLFHEKPGSSQGFSRILDFLVRIHTEYNGHFEFIMERIALMNYNEIEWHPEKRLKGNTDIAINIFWSFSHAGKLEVMKVVWRLMSTRGYHEEHDQMRFFWPLILGIIEKSYMATTIKGAIIPFEQTPRLAYGVIPHTPLVMEITRACWDVLNVPARYGFDKAFANNRLTSVKPDYYSPLNGNSIFTRAPLQLPSQWTMLQVTSVSWI